MLSSATVTEGAETPPDFRCPACHIESPSLFGDVLAACHVPGCRVVMFMPANLKKTDAPPAGEEPS